MKKHPNNGTKVQFESFNRICKGKTLRAAIREPLWFRATRERRNLLVHKCDIHMIKVHFNLGLKNKQMVKKEWTRQQPNREIYLCRRTAKKTTNL